MADSFGARQSLKVDDAHYQIFRLDAIGNDRVHQLPYTLKVLLENLLRHEDDTNISSSDINALAAWKAKAEPVTEIAFTPARVILQDFTGVPAIVDLAAMRDAVSALGGQASVINPLSPAELVIDHSVQVDHFGTAGSLNENNAIEFQRNKERYSFLRWGQKAFDNFRVVPPNTGIIHQVNLEFLSRVVFDSVHDGQRLAYPDTLVGTDSHTTMINGLGILGWGVGGIEAEAAMLGQPITMLIPQVVGFELKGELAEGSTATDLVLTVTQMLRDRGVVGKFVEFFGNGLDHLPLADRATLGNMSPEFGSTCAVFPIDAETLRYLELSGRPAEQVQLVEAYAKEQGMWRGQNHANFSDTLTLELGTVEPSLAGPKRPQDRIPLRDAAAKCKELISPVAEEHRSADTSKSKVISATDEFDISDGAIVIAAITSCTNTSNPAVMVGAGLLARNASAKGLKSKPWVKTSLAPGSKVVTEYLKKTDLLDDLEQLGFNVVGYGCTTCIGNSGPLPTKIAETIQANDIIGCSVLSGNRNFEGRIHPLVRMNFLASPPLVVAYALAGNMHVDLYNDPLGEDQDGNPVFLRDIWPNSQEIHDLISANIDAKMFATSYANVFEGDKNWNSLDVSAGENYAWDDTSTYVKNPPYFKNMTLTPDPVEDIHGARALALLGDSVTTDHISPAGAIAANSPAGDYLRELNIQPKDFNSYGSRRGNHEVMMRGTFANIRLRNQLAPGTEGGWTTHMPSGEQISIFEASDRYRQEGVPLIVIGGKEYGSGSSRDWAAKGTQLLGVQAVLVESYERIHRSNLIGMGVLPLQFLAGENVNSLGLDGQETFDIKEINEGRADRVTVIATKTDSKTVTFEAQVRIDTPKEQEYYVNGGILHYVLRQLAKADRAA
ncbi:MAG: aconitate hydratase AcnA [Pseudomonadota bacterium]|nr:aconitate hydratase AcnA [Pseudomonadota bacterium]